MKKLSFIPLLIFLLVNIQCGGGGDRTYSGTTPVSIKITEVTGETGSGADQLSGAVNTGDLASAVADGDGSGRQLSLCRFTITGPGMADMVREVDVTGKNSISETFNIPSGVNRKILIELFVDNDDKAIYQSSREGIILEDKPLALEMNLEPTADYSLPPSFEGVLSVSNAESRSVKLSWKPAADNITPHDRIQYLIYLSTESIIGREGEFINTYSLGKGSVLEGDALMSYEYDGDELLLISYEYEGALPSQGTTVTGLLATGRLQTGTPYYFIVKAKDEWGHEEANLAESEEVVVYMLDVAVQGGGTVTSDPAGINCGVKCSEDYLSGTEVTLTAQADGGAAFEGWTGNDQCGVAEVCNVIPDADTLTLTAKFCQTGRYYLDMDGDGYGDAASVLDVCIKPDNYVENGDDCDDNDETINPVATELCGNNIDEDCDGTIEAVCPPCINGETRPCGTDEGQCVAGIQICVDGVFSKECENEVGPKGELCDGLDNDCNGLIDDGIGDIPRICGTGACSSTGKLQCLDGQIVDTCVPGEPTAEICDGLDNDCNGQLDDGIVGDATACGVGACVSTGVMQCSFGELVDTCVPGEPTAEVCDGIDNDCNGLIDDGIADVPTTCGESVCGSTGLLQCINGELVDSCVPGQPSAEVCDGIDNDCNNQIDDGIIEDQTTCGVGACGSTGLMQCVNGGLVDTCVPGEPTAEICDGIDNDCNGQIDETFSDLGNNCTVGTGECQASGVRVCNSSGTGTTCNATAGTGSAEICDGIDNDCDNSIDETGDALCDNGLYCDGQETCGGISGCQSGTPVNCSDDVGCTDDSCDEGNDTCINTPNDGSCNDGAFCNGVETCSKTNDCQPGDPPCLPGQTCNEGSNICEDICTDVVITIGDNDGYGYKPPVKDNNDLPLAPANQQYCFDPSFGDECNHNTRSACVEDIANNCVWVDWQFDNQSSESGGDGAQYTDKVFYGPSFTFTIPFTPMPNADQVKFTLDVSGIQTSEWGASSITIDGVNHTSMLPTEQKVFGSSVRTRFINQADVSDGSVTVVFQGGTVNGGDAIAFDYFELEMKCP